MKKAIILLLVLVLASCSARKSSRSKTSEVSTLQNEQISSDNSKKTLESDNNVKTTTTTETNEKTGVFTETVTEEPIDPTKPATVVNEDGTRSELNNAKRTKSKTSDIRSANSKTVSNIDQSEKTAQNEEKDVRASGKQSSATSKTTSDKNTDRKQHSWLWLWWLLLVPLAIGLYVIKKKTPL